MVQSLVTVTNIGTEVAYDCSVDLVFGPNATLLTEEGAAPQVEWTFNETDRSGRRGEERTRNSQRTLSHRG